MNKEFIMRGQTASGLTEILNFSGLTPGYAYRMTEFKIYPSVGIGTGNAELAATVTAAKTHEDPSNPNFNNEGLIAVSMYGMRADMNLIVNLDHTVINDTFLITQDLILAVVDTYAGAPQATNWQCRFVGEKLVNGEEALANYNQFTISND
jgi:hypothetical protein